LSNKLLVGEVFWGDAAWGNGAWAVGVLLNVPALKGEAEVCNWRFLSFLFCTHAPMRQRQPRRRKIPATLNQKMTKGLQNVDPPV